METRTGCEPEVEGNEENLNEMNKGTVNAAMSAIRQ